MSKQFYITTPLYYVNDEPHIGHAYTTILADVLARYQRLFSGSAASVHFLTGLDEHGQKVDQAAVKAGIEPQEHCDRMAQRFLSVWGQLNIRYDDFIRTTEERHQRVVVDVLRQLYDKGDIYKKEYEGWYSVYEERFFTEKDLIDGKDPIGGRPVERLKEANYFFRMSQYQGWLIDHYESHPDAVIPDVRQNEVIGFLRRPLGDLCITRPKSRLSWGIPIPWDDDYVTYVWFDALLNYYTATLSPPDGKTVQWPADFHIIGKDILTTHAVYWPIMLHAAGLEPPKHILAHGWWLAKDDAKMSKSSGNVVKPLDLADIYGTDAFRYVLMREMVVGQDASFSEESFVQRFNSDLANDLGNLFSRLAKVWKTGGYGAYDYALPEDRLPDRQSMLETVRQEISALRPHTAIERIMQMVRRLNRFIEHLQPWKVVKTDPDSIRDDLAWALDTLDNVAKLLEPVMPAKMADLRGWIRDESGAINPQVGMQLFPRVKKIKVETAPKPERKKAKPEITIEDFAKLDLRVGWITSVRQVTDSDKLLAVEVDLGSEKRQVVAGIAGKYDPQSLVGHRVVIVANLKPIKLRGEVSHGMLLAAGDKEVIGLVTTLEDVPAGTIIR